MLVNLHEVTTRVMVLAVRTYLDRSPSFLANRPMQSSDSPIIRMDPQMAYTLEVPVMLPVLGSTSTRFSCTEAWSLAWMMRLLAELSGAEHEMRI